MLKITQTITVEIQGHKHELTQAEARELRDALNAVVGQRASPVQSPQPSISDYMREFDRKREQVEKASPPQNWPSPYWVGNPPYRLNEVICTAAGHQQ
jgi:hypothetical protein